MSILFLIPFYILFPIVVIYLCYKVRVLNKIGVVIICYIVGAVIGNTGVLPSGIYKYQNMIASLTVTLSLPLLLISLDIRRWVRLARKTVLSFLLVLVSVSIISFIWYFFSSSKLDEAWKIAGLTIGVYTGGTPNLAAIKTALNVNPSTFIVVHTYDTVISVVYLIFVITVAQRIFNKFLPRFKFDTRNLDDKTIDNNQKIDDIKSYMDIFHIKKIVPLMGAFLISSIIAISGFILSRMVPEKYSMAIAILTITTMGIGCSQVPFIQKIDKTFESGMYLIYVFCLVVGSMIKIDVIVKIEYTILFYIAFIIFGSMTLHAILCKFFKVDTDTFLITSTAAICSPPIVPIVAKALKNREIILSGLTTGIIGYAIGNYLGIPLAYVFKSLI